jgi:lysozyme family protein
MANTENFLDTLLSEVIKREGGYVHDPQDPGGETHYGISKKSYPHLDIKNLTIDGAKGIYYNDYYRKYRLGSLPVELQEPVLDWLVNSGRVAIKTLQRLIDTEDDGQIGPETLDRISKYPLNLLVNTYASERIRFYARLVQRKPQMAKFLVGWLNRALLFIR